MKNIVIIGGVAAGLKTAAQARRCDPHANITVLEKGKLISYGACAMPYFVGGEIDDIEDLMKTPLGVVRNPSFFKVKGIDVRTQTMAMAIDRRAKTVRVKKLISEEEETIPYDKLVIATGAAAIRPPLPGAVLGNIYTMWHPDDAVAIREGIEASRFKRAVVIGAGLIGMEMADVLSKRHIPVTVVEMQNQVFPAFLDTEIAEQVAKCVQGTDITVLTGEKVLRFSGEADVSAVETDKRTIQADLAIVAVGARPNVALAEAAGLKIGGSGAIAVDEKLCTSDPDIFAGGDCVENVHLITGQKVFAPMGSTANKHGRVIGENLCGRHARFKGVLNTVVVKIHDCNIGKTGLTEREAQKLGYNCITAQTTNEDRLHYMPEAKKITIKLIADSHTGKLLGMQAFGAGDVVKRVDVAASVLTLGGTIDDLIDIDLSYAPPYNSPIDNLAATANMLINKLVKNAEHPCRG